MADIFYNPHHVSVQDGWTAPELTLALVAVAGLAMAAHIWRL